MFPTKLCCCLVFVILLVATSIAVEKEWYSCKRREELVSSYVERMLKNPAKCPVVLQNLMELDVTSVTWRAGAIVAFVLASVAAILAGCCGSVWPVFFGVFFAALCCAYLRAGHERTHVSGPVYAALRTAALLQAGVKPEELGPRQL